MAEPASSSPHPRLELSLVEARTRFVQLARLAGLTNQTTVVTEDGRPLAAIVPIDSTMPADTGRSAGLPDRSPQINRSPHLTRSSNGGRSAEAGRPTQIAPAADPDRPNPAAAGWIRRIDKLRAEFRRQHVGLEQALEDAWRQLDRLRPPGSDPEIDALRTAHADLRRPPSTA